MSFVPDWVNEILPRVLPYPWKEISTPLPASTGKAYRRTKDMGLEVAVIVTGETELDGKRWMHVSVSTNKGMPGWYILREVKDIFIGRDKEAIQKLPKQSEYVNINPSVLHLWHCADGEVTPDFTRGLGTI